MTGNGGAPQRALISDHNDHDHAALGSLIKSCFQGSFALAGGLNKRGAHVQHASLRLNAIKNGLTKFFGRCSWHFAIRRRSLCKDGAYQRVTIRTNRGSG